MFVGDFLVVIKCEMNFGLLVFFKIKLENYWVVFLGVGI